GSGSSSSSSSSAAAAVPTAPASTSGHVNIQVGANQKFVFSPSNVTAPVGTLVTFFFPSAIAHSVTQSSFDAPCTHLASNGSSPAGFDSGLQQGTQFTINITDASVPIYFHCKAPTHCGLGMVGSINAPTTGDQTFQAFQAAAVKIGSSEKTESDTGFASGGVGAVATASAADTATASASASSSSGSTKKSGAVGLVASGLTAAAGAVLGAVL
ncbi:hypothetical protein PUNSTDRAFT_35682, partial [Punctularia strigosozonata HHB-11173 SS5]